jgi:hypothetical protein
MKKVVKMMGLCALMALALCSCNKKNQTNGVSFTATIAQPESTSRTHGEFNANHEYYLVWDDADMIKIVNPDGSATHDFTVVSHSGSNAYFRTDDATAVSFLGDLKNETYYAFYPNPVYDDVNKTVTMQISSSQVVTSQVLDWGSFADETYPMYGDNSAQWNNFVFDSDAGFLTLVIKGMGQRYFDKVVLTTTDGMEIAGELVYNYDGTGGTFVGTTDHITITSDHQIQVKPSLPAEISFVLPECTLNGFEVDVYLGNTLLVHKVCSAPVVIEAKKYKVIMPELLIP